MTDKKIKYLRVPYDIHADLLLIKEKSGIVLERLVEEALKRFIAENEHFKKSK